ncbi:hypothetical protein K402DRAFT_419364 [Aulographum hederae CBS 113979]|uniref:COX assembly mitochondrial protein n=1 Tax=Aulographum hederae CBS 113979 TaxID=1176131 RepID=A0A6G1H638_9PEZI|nr:hypothetical protein K402DRAFT_419364 [Aulographum hederae CBS 113979]
MATPDHNTPSTIPATPSQPQFTSRNPLPLSAGQEAQVRDLYYKRVRSKCADEIRDFAACALNRTVTAIWICRPQRLAMNTCMIAHANRDEEDRAREEWFAKRDERRREREEKERQKEKAMEIKREWWGLDEKGNRIHKKPEEQFSEEARRVLEEAEKARGKKR